MAARSPTVWMHEIATRVFTELVVSDRNETHRQDADAAIEAAETLADAACAHWGHNVDTFACRCMRCGIEIAEKE